MSREVEEGEHIVVGPVVEISAELRAKLRRATIESEEAYTAELAEDCADLERALAEDDGEHISLDDHRRGKSTE